jgi:hypothetical protein
MVSVWLTVGTVALAQTLLFGASAAPTAGTFTEVTSFSIPKSPSGLFFHEADGMLYILCGTSTNGDHYIYVYTTAGAQQCMITIPYADPAKMARVDGFYIVGSKAYIVDSQGPIYASTTLGGSVYEVSWTSHPCGCTSTGCTSSTANWSPTVTKTHTLNAADASISDGGGNDDDFRNSGIVVVGEHFYAVNGVHPVGGLTCCYPKSLVKASLSDTSIVQKWSFTAATLGHDVDMEGLTCGADGCSSYIYIGDEYNYIYKLNLATSDPAAAVEVEWDVNSAVGTVQADKGIESLTYSSSTSHFYAGIQGTSKIHVFALDGTSSGSPTPSASPTPSGSGSPSPVTTASPTPASSASSSAISTVSTIAVMVTMLFTM